MRLQCLHHLALLLALSLLGGCAALTHQQADTRLQILRLEAHAMHAYHRERPAEALTLYQSILELDPQHQLAWYRVANLQAGNGDFAAAMAAYQRALELDPDDMRARYNLGLVHIRHGAVLLDAARDALAVDDPQAAFRADRFLAYLLTDLVRSVDIAVDCACEQQEDSPTGDD